MGSQTNDLESNKQTVRQFWQAFSESRFEDALDLLDENATWWIAGTTDISGTYSKQEFAELVAGIAEGAPNGIRVTPKEITAEDDRVAMEAESYGEMSNGKLYNNHYHLQHVVRAGKLLAVREYLDTQHVQDVFGTDDMYDDDE